VDSDSDDFTHYKKIKESFPKVELLFVKNKNYEYGAWKYILNKYPEYDIYFCIQDTNIVNRHIHLNVVDNNTAYTNHHHTGFNTDIELKDLGRSILNDSNIHFSLYDSIINTYFTIAQHNLFIVNNSVMHDIFNTLLIPPLDKTGSWAYERIFGLYFIMKHINTLDLNSFICKYGGQRL
jgi:hypothetical protein